MNNRKFLTMGSLFDGSGGFPLAASLNGVQPLWSSEVEPYPIKVTSKRFPNMKHYGDISKISGKEIEPVDIITFGSPCQDMSLAGKRKGMANTCGKCNAEYNIKDNLEQCPQCGEDLKKTRSGLFVEAIRIIKEMREATNDQYPTFIVWENVPGAYSSNKGEDFRTVLEEICSVTEHSVSIPQSPNRRWLKAGEILGDNYSVAWRTLDAQYWGVPQRRNRIFLVADFGGQRASEILFESARLQRNLAPGKDSRKRAAADPEGSARTTCKNELIYSIGRTAWRSGVNFRCKPTIDEGIVPTLTTDEPHAVSYNKYEISALIDRGPYTYGISAFNSNGMKSDNPHSGFYKADTSRTLETSCCNPASNQGGMAVVCLDMGGGKSSCSLSYNQSPTLTCTNAGEPVVLNEIKHFGEGSYGTFNEGEVSTLKASGGTLGGGSETLCLNTFVESNDKSNYIVRRLTPLECSRLQGFPDWWTEDTETENPTEEEMSFWRDVFETHRKVITGAKKPKTDNQIRKWLREPGTDGAIYKMWGNGIALPCAFAVFNGIVSAAKKQP